MFLSVMVNRASLWIHFEHTSYFISNLRHVIYATKYNIYFLEKKGLLNVSLGYWYLKCLTAKTNVAHSAGAVEYTDCFSAEE